MKTRESLAFAAMLVCAGSGASAGVITDESFFDLLLGVTEIDFETDGSGAAVSLINGQSMVFDADEYASFGVGFDGGTKWVNDGGVSFDAAQMLDGVSGDVSIPGADVDQVSISFNAGVVDAVGFWIANNHEVDGEGPTITAFDAMDNVLESVTFGNQDGGSIFVDGRIGSADYGFMGLTTDGTPIARIEISKDAAILDNLTFGDTSRIIPLPTSVLLGSVGMGCIVLRRRRPMGA